MAYRRFSCFNVFALAALAGILSLSMADTALAQLNAKNAHQESSISQKYSDAELQKFVELHAELLRIEAVHLSKPRLSGDASKYPGRRSEKVIDQKNEILKDARFHEMAMYVEKNGLSVAAYNAMRMEINSDKTTKKRFKAIAKAMGHRGLDISHNPFKGAPAHTGTY